MAWGSGPVGQSWKHLREYFSLGYSSIGMRALEEFAYTFLTVLAGFLASPDVTQVCWVGGGRVWGAEGACGRE